MLAPTGEWPAYETAGPAALQQWAAEHLLMLEKDMFHIEMRLREVLAIRDHAAQNATQEQIQQLADQEQAQRNALEEYKLRIQAVRDATPATTG